MHEKVALVGALLCLGIFVALGILAWRRRVLVQRAGDAWIFQYSWPFRAIMVLCAVGVMGMCSLALNMYFRHAQPDEECYCPELAIAGFGFFFLLGLYVAVAVFRDQVTVSDKGLTIRGVLSRLATLAWQDIEVVSFEWGSFRVRRKGGGSRWISHDLGGNEELAEHLDQYLYPADPALVPTYVERLRHKNGFVRRGAAVGLSKLGPAATPATSRRLRHARIGGNGTGGHRRSAGQQHRQCCHNQAKGKLACALREGYNIVHHILRHGWVKASARLPPGAWRLARSRLLRFLTDVSLPAILRSALGKPQHLPEEVHLTECMGQPVADHSGIRDLLDQRGGRNTRRQHNRSSSRDY